MLARHHKVCSVPAYMRSVQRVRCAQVGVRVAGGRCENRVRRVSNRMRTYPPRSLSATCGDIDTCRPTASRTTVLERKSRTGGPRRGNLVDPLYPVRGVSSATGTAR